MMTILAIVNANKEGQIESKMLKSRQMEEIREARKREAEKRREERKGKLVNDNDPLSEHFSTDVGYRRKRRTQCVRNGNEEMTVQSKTPNPQPISPRYRQR